MNQIRKFSENKGDLIGFGGLPSCVRLHFLNLPQERYMTGGAGLAILATRSASTRSDFILLWAVSWAFWTFSKFRLASARSLLARWNCRSFSESSASFAAYLALSAAGETCLSFILMPRPKTRGISYIR